LRRISREIVDGERERKRAISRTPYGAKSQTSLYTQVFEAKQMAQILAFNRSHEGGFLPFPSLPLRFVSSRGLSVPASEEAQPVERGGVIGLSPLLHHLRHLAGGDRSAVDGADDQIVCAPVLDRLVAVGVDAAIETVELVA
jgi:hypothetical protein